MEFIEKCWYRKRWRDRSKEKQITLLRSYASCEQPQILHIAKHKQIPTPFIHPCFIISYCYTFGRSSTLFLSGWRIGVLLSWHDVGFPAREGFDGLLGGGVGSDGATNGHEESLQR